MLTGCASFWPFGSSSDVKTVETVKVAVEKPRLNLPNAKPLTMKPVKWVVVTRENAEKVFAELEAKGEPVALFALTSEGYEALALNIADIKGYMQTQKTILIQYREYYEPEKKTEEVKDDNAKK